MKMEIENIDILSPPEITNDDKDGKIKKLEFVSKSEVKELVKGNQYDNLKLTFSQETELNTSKIIKDPSISKASKFQIKIDRVTLKLVKVVDYQPHYLDDVTIYSHKYTLETEEVSIGKESNEEYGVYIYK